MRFILILLVAVALTLTWQSTVLAGFDFDFNTGDFNTGKCSEIAKSDKKKAPGTSSGEDESECE